MSSHKRTETSEPLSQIDVLHVCIVTSKVVVSASLEDNLSQTLSLIHLLEGLIDKYHKWLLHDSFRTLGRESVCLYF